MRCGGTLDMLEPRLVKQRRELNGMREQAFSLVWGSLILAGGYCFESYLIVCAPGMLGLEEDTGALES